MARKSLALRLAPPTSAPLTFSTDISVAALSGFDRAAVKNSHPPALGPKEIDEIAANGSMDDSNVLRRRRQPGANRPDRLIGDDRIRRRRRFGQRSLSCRDTTASVGPAARSALSFADTNNRDEPGPMRRFRLRLDLARSFRRDPPGARNGRRLQPRRPRPSAFRRRCRPYERHTAWRWQS